MKKTFFLASAILFSAAVFAIPFNSKLSDEERAKLENGEVITRNIDKYKNLSIDSESFAAQTLRKEIDETDPNYLAELAQIRPYEGNEDLIEKLYSVLSDIESYAGIPYWSVQHDRYFDLYKTAEIKSKEQISGTTEKYEADLYMSPFGNIETPISIEKGEDYLIYISSNNNSLKVKGMTAVKKQNLKSVIILFKDGDNWILYGAGGCKAPKVAMFQKRIETSFINRIKTFCNYVFTKI